MKKPSGKCFCKNCEDCHWFMEWDMVNTNGLRKIDKKCLFHVLAQEIPNLRGCIEGVQGAAEQARNRSMETKSRIEDLGGALAQSMTIINKKLIGQ